MSYLESYYLLEKAQGSKTRYDVEHSTGINVLFESLAKNGKLWFYLSTGYYTRGSSINGGRDTPLKLCANQAILNSNHISKLFKINSSFGYLDIKNTGQIVLCRFDSQLQRIELYPTYERKRARDLFVSILTNPNSPTAIELISEMDRLRSSSKRRL